MCVCCYNRCHGDAVKGFWALCLQFICWFVGDLFAVEGFGALWDNIYDVCVITLAMIMLFKGFWALWDNIYGCACLLLYIFSSFLTDNLLVYDIIRNICEAAVCKLGEK
jgi:hypothetical protein